MDRLIAIKDQLINAVQSQMTDLSSVDAEEMGEVVDMIKDIEEAIYYCSVTKAMTESVPEEKEYYVKKHIFKQGTDDNNYRDKMYFSSIGSGKSPMTRKAFMEHKQQYDKTEKQKELEKYVTELGEDITEMLDGLSTEEKTIVKNKIATLAAHIS